MAPHLHLSGDTLEQVRETLHARYGGAARLVSADKVRDGGIAGLLGRWHVEVVAELPEGTTVDESPTGTAGHDDDEELRQTAARGAAAHALTGRSGLAALLAAADDEEELLRDVAPATEAQPAPARAAGVASVPAATGESPAVAADLRAPAQPRPAPPLVPELDTPATRGRDFAALLSRLGDEERGVSAPRTGSPAGAGTATSGLATSGLAGLGPAPLALPGGAGPGASAVIPGEAAPWADEPVTVGPDTPLAGTAVPVPPLPELPLPPVPTVLAAPGDLVVVLGVGDRALRAARTMAVATGAQLHTAGTCEDPTLPRVQTPRSAIAARAGAVRAGTSAVVGYGLGSPVSLGTRAEVTAQLSTAVGLGADQVWLVVDARHKPEDVALWARRISSRVPVDALVVIGVGETSSPESVNDLGLPVGWVDGGPAARALL